MKDNKGFIFYKSYANAVRSLPAREQLKLLWAIIDKGLEDKEPNLQVGSVAMGMYSLIAPNLEANRTRYQRTSYKREEKNDNGSFDTEEFFSASLASAEYGKEDI